MEPMSEPAAEQPPQAFDMTALGLMLQNINTNIAALNRRFDTSDNRIETLQTSINTRLEGVQSSINDVERRLSATETQCQEFSQLSQRIDALQAQLVSSGPASSSTPLAPVSFATVVAAAQAAPLPEDSMSDDHAPPARRQRVHSPQHVPPPVVRQRRAPPHLPRTERDAPPNLRYIL